MPSRFTPSRHVPSSVNLQPTASIGGLQSRRAHRATVYLCSVLAGAALVRTAAADTILTNHNDSLTTMLASASAGQAVLPLVDQRGVNIDGTMREGGGYAWMLAGNSFEAGAAGAKIGDVNLITGNYSPTDVDIALPAPGMSRVVIGRTFNGVQASASNGYQGYNWFQICQPEIAVFDGDGNREDTDLIYVVYGADRFLEFKRTAANVDTFRGVNGAAGIIEYVAGTPDVYVWYDQRGTTTYFFGDDTASNAANFQFWKVEDTAGNVAYAGHPTNAASAITAGYENADKKITKLFDGAGRRYCFTYTTGRLTKVVVETDAGGGWGNCETETEVARVEYEYYSGVVSDGTDGDLKLVRITTPLSAGADPLERRKYYRYWKGGMGQLGMAHSLKMVIGFEGCRKFDAVDGVDMNDDSELVGASDNDLRPYAEAYFEYDNGEKRIGNMFLDGQCGCGTGTNGELRLDYESNGSFSPSSGYQTTWHRRVVVQPVATSPAPGAPWITQYFDECAQPISRVLSDDDPENTPDFWPTNVVRDASGRVIEVHTPANTTYAHNSSINPPSATFTLDNSVGLVWFYQRISGGDLDGFLEAIRQQAGNTTLSTTSKFQSWTQYATRDLNIDTSVNVTRPVVDERRAYHTATSTYSTANTFDETEMNYTWWSSTNTDPDYIAIKAMEVEAPTVQDTTNGSDAPTYRRMYIREDGTTAFAESATGRFTYTQFTNGQLIKHIQDVKTNQSFGLDYDPSGDFGVTESGDGWDRITTYTYDAQGRLITKILNPNGTDPPLGTCHESGWHYAQLADARVITYSIPRIGSYYGPLGVSISNHAGNTEDCLEIILAGGSTNDAPSGWSTAVSFVPWDWRPMSIVSAGGNAPTRLIRSEYNETGTRLLARRAYHNVPAGSWPGDPDDDFDGWELTYDHAGRVVRVVDPTGSISRTTYDVLGRVVSRQIGTDDYGDDFSPLPSGSNNMTETERLEYDGGSANGNSYLTERTVDADGNWGGAGDQRVTTFFNDYRGRTISTVRLLAPHQVTAYDNLGRITASANYSSSSGLDATSVPTTTSARVTYNEAYYDARGQVWKSIRHAVNQSTGASADTLEALTWYDPDGRVIMVDGEQLSKTRYDRFGRVIQTFVLANHNDDANDYTDVFDSTNQWAKLTGDKVLEEVQTAYRLDDDSGTITRLDEVWMQATISRLHDDTSTTGPLEETYDGGDDDPLEIDAADVLGRIQITAMWYDHLHRVTTTAAYGTNEDTENAASWTKPSAPTSSAAGELVTITTYGDNGLVEIITDPLGNDTTYVYDGRDRVVETIADNGGINASTKYTYVHGLQTEIWVDVDNDDVRDVPNDQITTYTYGTTKGSVPSSEIATGHLLRLAAYPDTSGSSDLVAYSYNALSELEWTRDQSANVIEMEYDELGREKIRKATTIDTPEFDDTVKRIETVYLARGLVDTVTQYNATSSGTALDQVQYTYDTWGNVTKVNQDVDSSIGTSGRAAFAVDYTYEKNTTGRNTIRQKNKVAGGITASNGFFSSGSKLDDDASRVTRIDTIIGFASTQTALYEYLGANQMAGVDLLQPDARWNFYDNASGTDPYPDLDQFNRIDQSRWTSYKTTGTRNVIDLEIAHDFGSNIDAIEDNVNTSSAGGTTGLFDVDYVVDGLNRLTMAEEGDLSAGTIGTRTRKETWTLSVTGNWTAQTWTANGDSDTFDIGDFELGSQTYNDANEWTSRIVNSGNGSGGHSGATYTQVYDPVGNMTDDGQHYTYKYDVFGRLKEIRKRSNNDLVVEYTYNGLSHRVGWHYDADTDNDVDGSDPWYWFLYDLDWRICATYRGSDASAKERFVYNGAGMEGTGSASYIDSVIFRDKDANTSWTSASDGNLEQRYYYLQNWRADVNAVLTSGGSLVERVKYSSYGIPFGMPVGDMDSNGQYDSADRAAIPGGTYDVRKDCELDGDTDAADVTHADNTAGGGTVTMGRGFLTMAGTASRKGYAGYEYEYATRASRHLSHVRHRVYDAAMGRWMRRDPIEYLGGMNLYEYVGSQPNGDSDPLGLSPCSTYDAETRASICGGGGGGRRSQHWAPPGAPTTVPVRPSINPNNPPITKDPILDPRIRPGDPTTEPRKGPIPIPSWCPSIHPVIRCIKAFNRLYCIGEALSPKIYNPEPESEPAPEIPTIPGKEPFPGWCKTEAAALAYDRIGTAVQAYCHEGRCSAADKGDACRKQQAWEKCRTARLAEERFLRICPDYAEENRGTAGSEAAKNNAAYCKKLCDAWKDSFLDRNPGKLVR